jgi:hypothetical protein
VSAAQRVSHKFTAGQNIISQVLDEDNVGVKFRLTGSNASELRALFDDYSEPDLTDDAIETLKVEIRKILIASEDKGDATRFQMIPIEAEQYNLLFSGKDMGDVVEEIIAAVKSYRIEISRKAREAGTAEDALVPIMKN